MISVKSLQVMKSGKNVLDTGAFEITAGEKVVFEGPNGSGKTTLLKVLSDLETGYQGKFESKCNAGQLTMVHQDPFMIRGSVRTNLLYGLTCLKVSKEESQKRIQTWGDTVGIHHLLDQNARSLSGGERKKVAITRALVLEPKLLFIDEPLAELDSNSEEKMIKVLSGLEEMTIVVTTPTQGDRFKGFRKLSMNDIRQKELLPGN